MYLNGIQWVCVGHVLRVGERRGAYRVLVGYPGGKRPLGRPRSGWEDNIKEVWIDLTQDTDRLRAFVNATMKL